MPGGSRDRENLPFVPSFVGELKNATPFQSVAGPDFGQECCPLVIGKPCDIVSGKRHYARCVVDSGGEAETPSAPGS